MSNYWEAICEPKVYTKFCTLIYTTFVYGPTFLEIGNIPDRSTLPRGSNIYVLHIVQGRD